MKAESTTVAKHRETKCHEEKESTERDLEFSSWISVVVPTCLSIGFVFTGSRLV